MLKNFKEQVDDFWPYYVNEHSDPINRRLHFIGNTNLLFWLVLGLLRRSPWLLVFAVASSYAIAWVGHFVFERNIPATFRYPVLAGVCDLLMYHKTLRGEMDAEVVKYVASQTQGGVQFPLTKA
jgi:hypothetical protein